MSEAAVLRPRERRIRRLAEEGVVPAEIGRRFRRSESYVENVLAWSELPNRSPSVSNDGRLRPLERRLLRWHEQGVPAEELADRFGHGPMFIERVLTLARYKLRTAPPSS